MFDLRPLYASSPHQAPFISGEQQIEIVWIMDCTLHCNPVVTVPQEFFDTNNGITLVGVDVEIA